MSELIPSERAPSDAGSSVPIGSEPIPSTAREWPLHYTEVEGMAGNFVDTISLEKVRDLASRHKGDEECLIDDRVSYTRCYASYFAFFPASHVEWEIRVPLKPCLLDGWNMLRSEVATMRHVKRNTTIPVPTVHAYGNNATIIEDSDDKHPFLIMDRVRGSPVDGSKWKLFPAAMKRRLLSGFADMLAQLQTFGFAQTGSLYPSKEDDTEVIGEAQFMDPQRQAVRMGKGPMRPPTNCARDVVNYSHQMLYDHWELGHHYWSDQRSKGLASEVIALDALETHLVHQRAAEFWDKDGEFFLQPTGFQFQGVMVDHQFNILGFCDWTWCVTLPRQLCVPPSFIGHEDYCPADVLVEWRYIWSDFQQAITPGHPYYEHLQFWQENEAHRDFAGMLRAPEQMLGIYFGPDYIKRHSQPFGALEKEYMAVDKHKGEFARRKKICMDYCRYVAQSRLGALLSFSDKAKSWINDFNGHLRASHEMGIMPDS